MQCTRIVKLKHTHNSFEGIRLSNVIGPLYNSKTKKKNYKTNDVFVDNNKSQNNRISHLLVERFDLYVK